MSFDPYFEWLGIPPEQQPPSHYLLLGLDPGENDPQQIRAAADSLLRSIRELRHEADEDAARQIFAHVKQARSCLLDEVQKRAYDRELFGSETTIPFDEPAELEEIASHHPKRSKPGIAMLLGFLMGPITVAAVYFLFIKQDDPPKVPPPEELVWNDPVTQTGQTEPDDRVPQSAVKIDIDKLRGGSSQSTSIDRPIAGAVESVNDELPVESADPPEDSNLPDFPAQSTNSPTQKTNQNNVVSIPKVLRPEESELSPLRKTVRELYDKRIFSAKDADAKQSLAIELLGQVKPGQGSPAESYVQLELAIELATAAGDLELTDQAIAKLTTIFDESDLPHRAKAVQDWAAIISKDYRGDEKNARQAHLAVIATYLAEEAGRRNADEIAMEMYRLASSQSKYSGEDDRSRELLRLAQNYERLARERKAAQPLLESAIASPSDPRKNDAAAEVLCFQLNDWDAGMPFLSRGSDETLKRLALRDLKKSEDVPESIQLADDWWAASENLSRERKPALQNRAVGIYERVYDHLDRLQLTKALTRMKTVGPVTVSLPSPRIHFDFDPKSIVPAGRTATIQNQVGKVAPGLLVGAPLKKGLRGGAFLMNGADHYVRCPNTTHVIGAEEECTLSVWINPQLSKLQDIAGKFETGDAARNRDFGLYLESDNTPVALVSGSNASFHQSDRGRSPVSLGDWTHLVMTWDRRKVRLYVNGQNPDPPTSSAGPERSLGTSFDFTIGGMHRPSKKSASHRFAGAVDELRLFSRSLKPVEVMYLYLMDAP